MTALLSWPGRWLSAGLLAGGLFASPAWATTFQLQPRDLGAGFSFAGTLTTDGTVGALDAGNVLAWDIVVTQTAEIHYTPQNRFSTPARF